MMEKTNSRRSIRKRDPLGKSFSDILRQTVLQEEPVLPRSEAKVIEEYVGNQPTNTTRSEQVADNSQESLNTKIIGLILKEKRERKSLTLDRISDDLCLKTSLLKYIEDGRWENLPHKVYTRGYVRKYAELLGVHDEIMPYLTENNEFQKSEGKPKVKMTRRPDEKLPSFLLPKKTTKAMFLYAVVIALTLGFFLVEGKRKQGAEMSKLENAVQVSDSISENDAKKNVPNFTDTKKLMITCHERTWISVIIDGTEKKEFTLKPQEVVILNAKEKFDLLIGNAGGIRLLLDGKDTSFTGENGQVKRVTLS
jgi:cytoskeletal protein RodZ